MTRHSNYNFNVHRKDLHAAFEHFKKIQKVVDHNPVSTIDKLPHDPRVRVIPTEEEVIKILMAAGPTEKVFLKLILQTSARVDEIQRLRWQDVSFEKKTLSRWTRKRKGGNYEPIIIEMNRDVHAALWSLYQQADLESPGGEYVFPNPQTGQPYHRRYKMIKGICRRAGVRHEYTFHDLRAFVAHYLKDQKKLHLKAISEFLGHKELRTTEIYLRGITVSSDVATNALEGAFEPIPDEYVQSQKDSNAELNEK
jgi:integrase